MSYYFDSKKEKEEIEEMLKISEEDLKTKADIEKQTESFNSLTKM